MVVVPEPRRQPRQAGQRGPRLAIRRRPRHRAGDRRRRARNDPGALPLHGLVVAPSAPDQGQPRAAAPGDCPRAAVPLRRRWRLAPLRLRLWGWTARHAPGRRARSVASPATGRRPSRSPQDGQRGPRLPGVAGRDSPSRTAPALPAPANDSRRDAPAFDSPRSAPPPSFLSLDSLFPACGARPKRRVTTP